MADEYIRREDAIRAVTPQYAPAINYALINMIQQVLAADVVPVVRCKDCKHIQHDALFGQDWCNGRRVTPDYFCADGERRSMDGGADDA